MSWRTSVRIVAGLVFALEAGASAAQTPAEPPSSAVPPPYQETVEVVGATPLAGLGVPRDWVPSNVQVAAASVLARVPGIQPAERLTAALASVHANDAQGNPFQPDIQFRGFAGSPLLGLPQGLAVYQDGVRLNEPFGDTVNWDLLPSGAIASVTLMPGSNPLFGLNALGGALSIQTKTGVSHPGTVLYASAGSFGRWWSDLESGGSRGRWSYFFAGRALAEDGWRDYSPSRVRQLFGNVEFRGDATTWSASVTGGANRLTGNGPAPIQLLEEDRAAIFTHPDETTTDMALVSLRGQHTLAPGVTIDGSVFYRPGTTRTLNGDDTTYGECEAPQFRGRLCADEGDGEPVVDQFGRLIAVDEAAPYDGTNNTSATRTRGWGGTLQTTIARPVADRANHLVAGANVEGARSRYASDTEIARLTDTRGTVGSGLLDADAAVRLRSTTLHTGLFLVDFLTVAPRLTLMASARYTHSRVSLDDQLGTALTGDHAFDAVNPAAGATYRLPHDVTAFGSFSAASRVPTPSELGCADPDDPCRLPNAFVADPPLDQVIARTWEGGLRGRLPRASWSASAFRTSNRDDILFISSGALTNQGYFANVGDTRRRGLELNVSGATGSPVQWGAAYTYLLASFQTPLTLSSPNHPDAVGGEIAVRPGDSIPTIPRHNVKGHVSLTGRGATVGGNVLYTSSQFLRGDEANLLAPIGGAAIVNLLGSYSLTRWMNVTGRVTNVFNRQYATFGLLGEADEVLGDEFDDPRFVSPGAPRAAWIGIEISLR